MPHTRTVSATSCTHASLRARTPPLTESMRVNLTTELQRTECEITALESELLTLVHKPLPCAGEGLQPDAYVASLYHTLTATNEMLAASAHASLPTAPKTVPRIAPASCVTKARVRSILQARRRETALALTQACEKAKQARTVWKAGLQNPTPYTQRMQNDRQVLVATRSELTTNARNIDRELKTLHSNNGNLETIQRSQRNAASIPDFCPAALRTAVRQGDQGVKVDVSEVPFRVSHERVINPWTVGERALFVSQYVRFGKDFARIAECMAYKNVHDVVRFYYDHKMALGLKDLLKDCRTQPFDEALAWRLAARPIPAINMFEFSEGRPDGEWKVETQLQSPCALRDAWANGEDCTTGECPRPKCHKRLRHDGELPNVRPLGSDDGLQQQDIPELNRPRKFPRACLSTRSASASDTPPCHPHDDVS